MQAWQRRKRQGRSHHSPSSIQGEWLAIDDQKNNILVSLCLASYLAANWLQKLEKKHCVSYAEAISVLMCHTHTHTQTLRHTHTHTHCVCVVFQFDLSITKQNYLFVRCQSCHRYLTLLCDVQISYYES